MNTLKLYRLEHAVLSKLLVGDHPTLVGLRSQLTALTVTSRELTGVGFFTTFSISDTGVPVRLAKSPIGDVEATILGLKHGAGFLLYIENGLLSMLEGYSYDEPWPSEVVEFSLRYWDQERKELLASLG